MCVISMRYSPPLKERWLSFFIQRLQADLWSLLPACSLACHDTASRCRSHSPGLRKHWATCSSKLPIQSQVTVSTLVKLATDSTLSPRILGNERPVLITTDTRGPNCGQQGPSPTSVVAAVPVFCASANRAGKRPPARVLGVMTTKLLSSISPYSSFPLPGRQLWKLTLCQRAVCRRQAELTVGASASSRWEADRCCVVGCSGNVCEVGQHEAK